MGGQHGHSRYVDYGRVADRYRQGRTLPADALDRWRRAVTPHLPARAGPVPLRVVDVGAGTGMFAAAWTQWTATEVVAVEPSPAMIRAGPPDVRYVRAVAEQLPLATGSMDLAWISTAVHHFVDLPRAAAECARVLRPSGKLLLRTFLPDRTEVSWIGAFPGYRRALDRFPELDRLAAVFGRHGLSVVHTAEVLERVASFAAVADWAQRMRHADTMLTALTDAEITDGLRVLRAQSTRQARHQLSLVVLSRPPG